MLLISITVANVDVKEYITGIINVPCFYKIKCNSLTLQKNTENT